MPEEGSVHAVRNPISIAGAVLVTFSAAFFLFVFLLDLFGIPT